MNLTKYRRYVLTGRDALEDNRFTMVRFKVKEKNNFRFTINSQKMHPLVLSGKAFWITHDELCLGYSMIHNDIFRPIFSHKRNKIVEIQNKKICETKKLFFRKRYLFEICKIIKLPINSVKNIVTFIY